MRRGLELGKAKASPMWLIIVQGDAGKCSSTLAKVAQHIFHRLATKLPPQVLLNLEILHSEILLVPPPRESTDLSLFI